VSVIDCQHLARLQRALRFEVVHCRKPGIFDTKPGTYTHERVTLRNRVFEFAANKLASQGR